MIKIFGRQPFFSFRHFVYEYRISQKNAFSSSLVIEKVKNNVQDMDMGYFSIRMLNKVLKGNLDCSEAYLFREEKENKVVGFALISYKGAKEIHYRIKESDAFITAVGVFPAFRGCGYSQSILSCINDICLKKKLAILRLVVDYDNYIAIKSYEKFGFKKIGERKFVRVMGLDFLINKQI